MKAGDVMKQIKQFMLPLIVYLLIVGVVYFIILFVNEYTGDVEYTMQELHGIIVAYEDDENGPIVIVRDVENGELKKFQFVGGVSEEVYGRDLKNIIENKEYDILLEIYYTVKGSEIVHIVDMAIIR